MKKIYSKADPSLLLHHIHSLDDAVDGRLDITDPKEFLQASLLKMGPVTPPRPHRHVWREGEARVVTQESWIVMRGRFQCTYYDTDNTVIAEELLQPGDCSITFQGGHALRALDDGSIFYEIKTGPYKGREHDNVTI